MRNTLTRRRLLQGTAGLVLVGLAGCASSASSGGTATNTESGGDPPGHGDSEHSHDRVSEPKQEREVLVNTARGENTTEYHFKPHVTWVTVGGTVTWKLQSGTHTATAYHPGNDEPRLVPEGTEAWDSGTLSKEGETYQHTFDKEGVYHYFCKPHEQFGMLGTVIVGKPHLDDQVALQTIPDNKPKEVRGKLKKLNKMVRSILESGHHEGTETGGHHEGTETGGHHEGTETGGHHEGTETSG
ncbi:MAG: plastocyanin/azurin family copper-binding protein [Halorhabdus sp.]